MATDIIMPALEMAQETGKILRWLKAEGSPVTKGEPIMEIETDKVTVEIESPASGTLANITAREGDVIPVGQTIAWVLGAGESAPTVAPAVQSGRTIPRSIEISASPVARKMAEEHGIDLTLIKPQGGRVEKADVQSYIEKQRAPSPWEGKGWGEGRIPASPKARRLASECGVDISALRGTGPNGAIIAADVPIISPVSKSLLATDHSPLPTVWRVMAERMTQSWTTVPHFYLLRDVDASGLVELRKRILPVIEKRGGVKPTYTDLLIKMIAVVLRDHPRVNASWVDGSIRLNDVVNVGLAIAIEDGLTVPVIHNTDKQSIGEIAARRMDLVERANAGKLKPADITGGTFTLTNLGMYNVDAFNAIINAPQAAILATGRITDRVVAVNSQPVVRPMMTLSLSCDHRVVDGARGAKFLDDLANLIEEPLGLLA